MIEHIFPSASNETEYLFVIACMLNFPIHQKYVFLVYVYYSYMNVFYKKAREIWSGSSDGSNALKHLSRCTACNTKNK